MLHSFISIYGWEPALWFGLSRQTTPNRVIGRRGLKFPCRDPASHGKRRKKENE